MYKDIHGMDIGITSLIIIVFSYPPLKLFAPAVLYIYNVTDHTEEQNFERGKPMKDLKHLAYFENLLLDAKNELIEQAQSEGKKCVSM